MVGISIGMADTPELITRIRSLNAMVAKYGLKYPRALLALLYSIIGLVIYSRVIIEAGFLFDDFEYIVGNPIVSDPSTLLRNFSDPRQIGYLSFALNYLVNGQAPLGYHLVNVVIHIVNAMLVFELTSHLLRFAGWSRERDEGGISFLLPACVGLVFLVHPLQTQAVSYVTQRFTSLATSFYLASVLLYLAARKTMLAGTAGKTVPRSYWLSLVCAIVAMKVKEISFTLPLAIIALEMLLIGRNGERKRSLSLVAPFVATMIIIPLVIFAPDWGLIASGSGIAEETRLLKIHDLAHRSALEYFATQTRVLVIYVRLLFFPYPQSAVYDLVASRSLFEPWVVLSLLFHLAMAAGAVSLWRRSRGASTQAPFLKLMALGIGWFYLTASVESSVLPIRDLIFEHRAYLPGFGLILAALSGLALFATTVAVPVRRSLFWMTGLVVVLSVILGSVAYARNRVWLNKLDFWNDVVAKSPTRAIGYNNRANALAQAGQVTLALQDMNKAISLFEERNGQPPAWESADYTPYNMANTYSNRGQVYEWLGERERANADFERARKILLTVSGR
jgi:hypothetical protein